jgi:hypothetical protein
MPPAAPSVAAVPCCLTASYHKALEKGEGDGATLRFTHVLLVNVSVDIRDNYNLGGVGFFADSVYVPDQNGTRFTVIFVERKLRGTAADHKKVYLARKVPTYPTTNL